MDDAALDDLRTFLPPLLRAMEGLGFVARRLNPPQLARVLEVVAEPEAALREARPRLDGWAEELGLLRDQLQVVADEALSAYAELGAADDMRSVYRALRHAPRAQEALYPLAEGLPPVSRYFLTPACRDDPALVARFVDAPEREDVGVFHVDNEPGARGGFSLYVPETYAPDRPHPIVFALHGGAGNGRGFLWSWLRDARAAGAILVAPTAAGDTWALQGPDADSPNLERILGDVSARWNVDPARRLLTGMSDGGTFAYVSGLVEGSPFTHLAPAGRASPTARSRTSATATRPRSIPTCWPGWTRRPRSPSPLWGGCPARSDGRVGRSDASTLACGRRGRPPHFPTRPLRGLPSPRGGGTRQLQPDVLPAAVDRGREAGVARVELAGHGAGAIGERLHLHGRACAEAGDGPVPDRSDLVPAVPAGRLAGRAEGEVRDAAAGVRVHAIVILGVGRRLLRQGV
ncbi:MAG TPA: hypothetical protein VHS81_07800, partial [Caulobacteraceae bacterium]|nr:hypothetical protein [Caulobacteraceae bacterium]